MLAKATIITNKLVFDKDHRQFFSLKHLTETVEVLHSVIALKSVNFENFRVDFTINHIVAYVLQLVVKAIDDDKTS